MVFLFIFFLEFIAIMKLKRYLRSSRWWRVRDFQKLFQKNYPRFLEGKNYGYFILFKEMLHPWVYIAKYFAKVEHKTTRNKKARHCIKVCHREITHIILSYSKILSKYPTVRFEHIVQRLYVFDQEMAFLLLHIVVDVLHDKRFKDIQPDVELYERLKAWLPNHDRSTLRFFFGWNSILPLRIPINLSFYLKQKTFLQVMLRFNRKILLTLGRGWINLLIQKFSILSYSSHHQRKTDPRMLLFKQRPLILNY